ncbi:MAG: MFS transporter, partial [Parvularculaceae bacterium]
MTPRKPGKHALVFLFITVLISMIGMGVILPVIPTLVQELTGLEKSAAAPYGGYLLLAYAVMQFFMSPILGGLSDRFGRRPVILMSLAAYSFDYGLMAF